MYPIQIAMIIVWAAVVAVSILVEYFTCQIVSIAFVPAAVIALVMAAFDVHWGFQILAFFGGGVIFVFACRPLFKKYLQKAGTESFTVRNKNIGGKFRLIEEVVDGKSSIVISDVTWTAKILPESVLPAKGDMVEIIDFEGNKAIVKTVAQP